LIRKEKEKMKINPMDFGMSKAYLVETDEGLLLVDAGPALAARRILNQIEALGYRHEDLKRIVITHADADHTGGLAKIQQAAGAPVAASQVAADAMALGKSSRPLNLPGWLRWLLRPLLRYTPVKADRILSGGEVLPGGLVVLDTAGHTPGHCSFFQPEAKVLFSGDSVLPHGESLDPSRGAFCWDEARAQEAFERQLALDPDHVYSGHGIWHRTPA
jgi:glyoxylase-like metal-dependent hydrolase (beta-lactamase superfamily II)